MFKKRGSSLVAKLESFVDPFDLDVFTPHMTTFIHRQIQRSWVSYMLPISQLYFSEMVCIFRLGAAPKARGMTKFSVGGGG